LSREVVLAEEDRSVFRDFAAGLWEYLQPVGALECLLADRIVTTAWRLRRILTIESGLFERDERFSGLQSVGTLFAQDSGEEGAFVKLSRYEVSIERSFFRALHELERLQARRLGIDVSPAAQKGIDVAVQGSDGICE
jgi:hypothetical protein